jgi:hypothetical protein
VGTAARGDFSVKSDQRFGVRQCESDVHGVVGTKARDARHPHGLLEEIFIERATVEARSAYEGIDEIEHLGRFPTPGERRDDLHAEDLRYEEGFRVGMALEQ